MVDRVCLRRSWNTERSEYRGSTGINGIGLSSEG